MAISTHIVPVTRNSESGQFVTRVIETAGVANSNDDPTLAEYIEAEADDDYLPVYSPDPNLLITAQATDL